MPKNGKMVCLLGKIFYRIKLKYSTNHILLVCFHIISFDPTVKELSNIKGNKIAEWHVTQSSSQITAISSHKLKTKPSLGPNLLCIYNIKRFKDNIGGGLNFYRTGR